MKITVDMLRAKNACEDQVELFEQVFPNGMDWPADLETAGRAGLDTAWGAVKFGLSGVREGWHPNGQLRYRRRCEHGKLHGVCEDWHANGQLWYRAHFEHGELHGVCEAWYANGELWFRSHYEHGKLVKREAV